ncbi:MAG: hypothetical protein ACM3SW_17975 [Actinomycetota bacterium]
MRTKTALSGFLVLFLCFNLNAQFSVRPAAHAASGPVVSMDDLLTAAHRYFRDTAELPMVQTTTFSVTDHSGRTRRPKTITTTYVFHGYSKARRTTNATFTGHESFWALLRGSKMMKIAGNSAFLTMLPGLSLYAEKSDYALHINASGKGEEVAQLTPVKPCSSFTMKQPQFYIPDHPCGPGEFLLGKDLTFQEFSFDVPGLPAPVKLDPFGHCTLRSYHADVTFQSVNLPGESDPFLVPKQVTATLETDKGTIVISSTYKPRQAAAN